MTARDVAVLACQNRCLGVARVSTVGQTLTAQLDQLKAAGCTTVYRDTASGARANRRELNRMLKQLTVGDVMTVTRLDRLARSTSDLLRIAERLTEKAPDYNHLMNLGPIRQALRAGLS